MNDSYDLAAVTAGFEIDGGFLFCDALRQWDTSTIPFCVKVNRHGARKNALSFNASITTSSKILSR